MRYKIAQLLRGAVRFCECFYARFICVRLCRPLRQLCGAFPDSLPQILDGNRLILLLTEQYGFRLAYLSHFLFVVP